MARLTGGVIEGIMMLTRGRREVDFQAGEGRSRQWQMHQAQWTRDEHSASDKAGSCELGYAGSSTCGGLGDVRVAVWSVPSAAC